MKFWTLIVIVRVIYKLICLQLLDSTKVAVSNLRNAHFLYYLFDLNQEASYSILRICINLIIVCFQYNLAGNTLTLWIEKTYCGNPMLAVC